MLDIAVVAIGVIDDVFDVVVDIIDVVVAIDVFVGCFQ